MVDLLLPAAAVEDVAAAVGACLAARPAEFTGKSAGELHARGGAPDLGTKATPSVQLELTHAGAAARGRGRRRPPRLWPTHTAL